MTDEPVTLPLHCAKCGQAVTLSYRRFEDSRVRQWICPYTWCGSTNQVTLGGIDLRAVARYEQPKE